ncbi:UNVERIFIED_CONTAM: hypothetical protein Slati_3755000 [Sesamum latifolium]|uniref:Uncharacterized protein n=1 Tax=Sesamum latifolium TaxID=2727402 RepID=A0AAW2U488_9LAMI
MDKEGSSPARGLRGRWLCNQVVGTRSLALRSGRWPSDQVAGARSLALRSGRGCQVDDQRPA